MRDVWLSTCVIDDGDRTETDLKARHAEVVVTRKSGYEDRNCTTCSLYLRTFLVRAAGGL